MKFARFLLAAAAAPLTIARRHRPRFQRTDPRILVIRRNRMGDMICTLPLLAELRRQYPHAHLAVACDPPGFPIAQACPSVNQVILLKPGWNRWQAIAANARHLQDYDWVIAAKGGFDRRLAVLARATNAARRIGYENVSSEDSAYYTETVARPDNPWAIHQVDALLALLTPLAIIPPLDPVPDLKLVLPKSALDFARDILAKEPFAHTASFALVNLSSTTPMKFSEEDWVRLLERLVQRDTLAIGLVGLAQDQARAQALATRVASKMVTPIATAGPLDLAALLQRASFLITAEGGAAHLASMGTPALVLWSEGPFEKWHSLGRNHLFVRLRRDEEMIPLERVWDALQPLLQK